MKPIEEMTAEEKLEWVAAEMRKTAKSFVGQTSEESVAAFLARLPSSLEVEERIVADMKAAGVLEPKVSVRRDAEDPALYLVTWVPPYPVHMLKITIEKGEPEEDTSDFITCDDCSGWASQTTANGHAPTCSHVQLCTCGHVKAEHKWKNRPPPISRAMALVCTAEGCTCWKYEQKA